MRKFTSEKRYYVLKLDDKRTMFVDWFPTARPVTFHCGPFAQLGQALKRATKAAKTFGYEVICPALRPNLDT